MNVRMDNRLVYDLEYGDITCDSTGVSIIDWYVDPTRSSSRNARLEMVRLEIIQMMTPTLSGATLRQNTVFVSNTDGSGDESEDESDGDGDEFVNVGQLEINLISTRNVTVGGEVTLKYLGPDMHPSFSVFSGENNVIGYVNEHDQDALLQFMNEAGRHVSAISNVTVPAENEGEDDETLIQWRGGTIVKNGDGGSRLQFSAIVVKEEYAQLVVQGLHELGSHREQGPLSPMNTPLIAKEIEWVKKIHHFIEEVANGEFSSKVPQGSLTWDGQNNVNNITAREDSWCEKMASIRMLHQYFPGMREGSWNLNTGKVTRYLAAEGPGRAEALAAFNEAWPQSCKSFWEQERGRFQMYANNPRAWRERIELHRVMGTLDTSREYDYDNIPEASTQRTTNNEVVILRSDTIDVFSPADDEYMVVCGTERIAQMVMATDLGNGSMRNTIDNNDAGIRTTNTFPGSLMMTIEGANRWVVRFEDGLEYIARSRIPSTDLDEGIYCDPSELPAPWRFVLHEHYQKPGGSNKRNLTATELEKIHNDNSEDYIANGVIPSECEKTYVRFGR